MVILFLFGVDNPATGSITLCFGGSAAFSVVNCRSNHAVSMVMIRFTRISISGKWQVSGNGFQGYC